MRRVILESPYAGEVYKNKVYAYACMSDCLYRNESPIASHLLYTQFLNDNIRKERELGIEAGLAWTDVADATVVYYDRGISKGMKKGIRRASMNNIVEFRSIYE